jgi:hypothetical protein
LLRAHSSTLAGVYDTIGDHHDPVPDIDVRGVHDSERSRIALHHLFLGRRQRLLSLRSYNQNLWIDHPFEGAAYLPR